MRFPAPILGWSYYDEQSVEYLAGLRAVATYRRLYCGAVLVGALSELELADIMNGLMSLPQPSTTHVRNPSRSRNF